jgi:hypothetical protein
MGGDGTVFEGLQVRGMSCEEGVWMVLAGCVVVGIYEGT